MKSPPILNQANQDLEVQVAEARATGETIIRNHLDNHLAHNSGASSDYISWIATLHPENAQVEIDERFFIPGNPWWSIYEETVNMPYATAVPMPAPNVESEQQQSNLQHNAYCEDKEKCLSSTTTHVSDGFTGEPVPPPARQEDLLHYCLRCNPMDMMLGLSTTFFAILWTFIFELIELIFYFVAALFYHIAQSLGPGNIFTGFFYSFFMIMYFAFATVDSSLLLGSVVGAEVCIFVGWILGCLFGGIWVANKRHQFVRRVCHRIRWAFRNKKSEPPRTFCKQTQVGADRYDQNVDNERANAELDKEFEIDDYEANQHAEAPAAAQHHHHEDTPFYAHAQPKADIEQESDKPF